MKEHYILKEELQQSHNEICGNNETIFERKIILGITCYNNTYAKCACGTIGGKESFYRNQCVCPDETYEPPQRAQDKHNGFAPLNKSNIEFIYDVIHDSIQKSDAIKELLDRQQLIVPPCDILSEMNKNISYCES